MRRTLTAAFALAALLGSAPRAEGQQIPSPYRYIEPKQSIGVFGGYLLADPSIGIGEQEVELGPRSAPVAGLAYTIRFTGPLSGEVRAGFSPTERTVYRPTSQTDLTPVPVATVDVSLLMAEAGLRFQLTGPRTWRGFAPYVVGSGGLMTDLDRNADAEIDIPAGARFDFGPSFAVSAAIGTDWFPTRRLSLRAEARDHLWQIRAPEGLRATGVRDVSEWTHNIAISLGAALHF